MVRFRQPSIIRDEKISVFLSSILDMKNISLTEIKKLRVKTQMPITLCKRALEKGEGNFNNALQILKEKGAEVLKEKKERNTREGLIGVYLHKNGKIGAMVKILVESDFAARNEILRNLCHELAMQVAAMDPKDINELLLQPYIKDIKKQVKNLIEETITKIGENIVVDEIKRIEV